MGATLAPPRRPSNRVSLHLNNSKRKHLKSENKHRQLFSDNLSKVPRLKVGLLEHEIQIVWITDNV